MSGRLSPLLLASASPRRTAILSMLGIDHLVRPAEVPEEPLHGEGPEAYVERLARAKAGEVASRHPDALVLAGDTVVVAGGRLLEKPADAEGAVAMLLELAGREHDVFSGLALALPGGDVRSEVARARVRFRPFGARVARDYVATGEPMDKAGAYGIQGRGAALVAAVEGDYYTVVGLPVSTLLRLLDGAGLRYDFTGLAPSGASRPVPGPTDP